MHAHNGWLLFAVYTAAQALKLWYSAVKSAASPHTPWESVRDYAGRYAPDLALRWAVATALFLALWDNPHMVEAVASRLLGSPFTLPFRLDYATAILLGLASDTIADVIMSGGAWLRHRAGARFGESG